MVSDKILQTVSKLYWRRTCTTYYMSIVKRRQCQWFQTAQCWLANHPSCSVIVPLENSGHQKVILHPNLIPTSFHGSTCIARCISMGYFPYSTIGLLSPITQRSDMLEALLHFHGAECFSAPAWCYLRQLMVILH